ncbi:FAD/NAD(P)-binding oxidoreductase [Prolixibacteraceae bacterium Z1-6]|uniref:FAD/NAD(P)-binding oxidoreductase n=1 Tax=Draconibacterium aestuarii TaxID=2998507 RepID=A0A9X3J4I2_9BACT|nr:FAD/NAD(P)-binding oxidoreductase [Prolixibacteraceae bacterium Z1-6]
MKKNQTRRKFIKTSALGLGGLIVARQGYKYINQSTAKAKIVIVGGGAAGITMAAYLSNMLRDKDITIIEPNEIHLYQPGFTLIAAGIFNAKDVAEPTSKLIPRGVTWLKDSVQDLNPESNKVVTKSSGTISFDYLVLVPGGQMNFDLVEGISRKNLGEGNAHCIYDYDGAQRCFEAIQKLENKKETKLVFTDTYTKLKCGGAPKKITFITDSYLRKKDARTGKTFDYYNNGATLMTPDLYGDRLATLYNEKAITPHLKHRLVAVDTYGKKATFEELPEPTLAPTPSSANYEKVVVDYYFLHFVPPMSTPDFVKKSPLATQEGDLKFGGWVDVDKETMVHNKYKNVISFGDVSSLPTSKTGAAIRMQAPIAAANLVSLMEGNEPEQKYNGYTACPIVTEYGKVLMCEFGYDKEIMPTISWLDPGVEKGMWWVLKKHGLKPMYYHGMLKGLI